MAIDVRLPRFSEEMKEGTVTRWLKAVGDPVAAGEAIAEIETEKVIVEVVAPQAGVILELVAPEQTVVEIDGLLCRISAVGEKLGAAIENPAPQAPKATSQKPAPSKIPPTSAAAGNPAISNVVPMAARPPREEPVVAALPVTLAVGAQIPPGVAISPLARRVASELGLDVTQVQGTGIAGKIVMSDLEPFLASRQPARTSAARGALPAVIPSSSVSPTATTYVEEPHTPLRRAIARRMAESKATIPHFYMTAELDATELLALRTKLNEQTGARISVNDYVLKATALALVEVPSLNAEFTEAALRRHQAVHLGFAVATDEGLFTPVVRDCHVKSVGAIAHDTQALIAKAKARSLAAADLQGGTFTISNLGMFDVVEFSAIINPPQVAILAVARPQERPVVVNGRVIVRSLLNVTVSADHRALDGITVAKFLQALRTVVETPERLLV